MTRRSPEQERAADALRVVVGLMTREPESGDRYPRLCKDFRGYAKSLPATIRVSGLGTAVAVLLTRSRGGEGNQEAYLELLRALEGWLCQRWPATPYGPRKEERGLDPQRVGLTLIVRVTTRGQDDYALAEAEALAWLEWLKKLANGLLVDGAPQRGAGS